MKRILLAVSIIFTTAFASAQEEWIDVTVKYIKNPTYSGNVYSGWEGTQLGGYNPKNNAEHYNRTFDTYQTITGLKAGKYRVSLKAFYRMGSATQDYSLYTSGNYSSKQNAQLYGISSIGDYHVAIAPLSSGRLKNSLGGNAYGVGNKTGMGWWTTYEYYVPDNMEAAYFWFAAGYYKNSVDCEVGEDGKLKIGIRKSAQISEDWTCLDDWKLEYLETVTTPASDNIVINELMAANVDVYRDPSTNFGSWVELYNPSDQSVSLGGLYVSDDANNLKKNRLNDDYGVLPAHGYAILNFDHYENYTVEAYRQINDKLSCDGGTIIISDGTNILAQAEYPVSISRVSYARTKDGGEEWGTTDAPTPGKSNAASAFAKNQLSAPEVNIPAKLFTGSLNVEVTIPEGATLRYTTDGSTPTLTNGKTSTEGKFIVSSSACYRFRLFQEGMLASPVVTRTYIRNNGNEPFPIISIVTDKNNLFESDYGIFQYSQYGRPGNGQNSLYNANMDWDRPVNFEYITTDNECVISQECDYSACGGWSRAWSPHSFKLKATKAYEQNNSFAYQFFGTESANPAVENGKSFLKHKTLQIRNGGNDTNARIKDAALQQVIASSGLYVEHQAWQPVHVYINAKSYDVLNMREPNNKHYGSANYGIDTDFMDQFEICSDSGYVQKEGTKDSFNKWYELSKTASSDESYSEICKLVDIDEYINYMAIELYLGSDDWPHNNLKGFRDQNDGKFRFVVFDLDFALNSNSPFSDFFNKQTHKFNELHGYDYSKNKSIEGTTLSLEIQPVTIFKNMLKNDIFRKKFIDTYCLVAGSVFEPNRSKNIVNKMSKYLSSGGYVNSTSTANDINNKLSTRLSQQMTQLKNCTYMDLKSKTSQTVTLASSISSASIQVNGMEVPTGKFSGQLYAPITLKASAPAGYRFLGWKTNTGEFVSKTMEYEMPSSGSQRLTAVWEKVEGENLADYAACPIKINEVSAGNDMLVNDLFKKDDWVELYNTTDVDLNVNGLYLSDNAAKPTKYQISAPSDKAAIISAHGHLIVWCSKREALTDIHASFKLGNDEGSVVVLSSSADFVANNPSYFEANPEMKEFADTLHYGVMAYDQTVGRYPDGGNSYFLFHHPTIKYANSIQNADIFVGKDIISGLIETGIVEVAADDKSNASYFTLNGIFVGKNLKALPNGIYVEVSNHRSRKVIK